MNPTANKNLLKAVIVVVIACSCLALAGVGIGISNSQRKINNVTEVTKAVQSAHENPDQIISIEEVQTGNPLPGCDPANCGKDYSKYVITNVSILNLTVEAYETGSVWPPACGVTFGEPLAAHLAPGASTFVYCRKDPRILPGTVGFFAYPDFDYNNHLGTWYVDGVNGGFYEVDSSQGASVAATTTAAWETTLLIQDLRLGPNPNDGTITVIGTLQNNDSRDAWLLSQSSTPIGDIDCYYTASATAGAPGTRSEFYCTTPWKLQNDAKITDVTSVCFIFNLENEDQVQICKSVAR